MTEAAIIMLIVWSIIAIGCLMFEFFNPCLITVWFALGAFVGLIFNTLSFIWYWQILAFITTSLLTLMIAYPLLKKVVLKKSTIPTNIDALINQEAVMLNDYDSSDKQSVGLAKIDGKHWTVYCEDNHYFVKNEKVVVNFVRGVKLIIKKT